jgi:hypothetical protein
MPNRTKWILVVSVVPITGHTMFWSSLTPIIPILTLARHGVSCCGPPIGGVLSASGRSVGNTLSQTGEHYRGAKMGRCATIDFIPNNHVPIVEQQAARVPFWSSVSLVNLHQSYLHAKQDKVYPIGPLSPCHPPRIHARHPLPSLVVTLSMFYTQRPLQPWNKCRRDACIKTAVDFQAELGNVMLGMTITGIVIDGSENPWFTLIDGATMSRSNPNVVIVVYKAGSLSMWVPYHCLLLEVLSAFLHPHARVVNQWAASHEVWAPLVIILAAQALCLAHRYRTWCPANYIRGSNFYLGVQHKWCCIRQLFCKAIYDSRFFSRL